MYGCLPVIAFFETYRYWVKCCAIVWGVLAVTFFFYMMTFFLGNHDFRFVRYGMPLLFGVFEGRFSQFLPSYLLTEGQILPIVNALVGFFFLAVEVVLLARWYGVKQNGLEVVGFGLLIVLNPYFLTQFYYVHSILSICLWHCLSVVGVILIYDGVNGRVWKTLGGIACWVCCFGGYVASVELVAVILLGKMWLDILSGRKVACDLMKSYLKILGACGMALLIYVMFIMRLRENHLIDAEMYNVQMLSVGEILRKFRHTWTEPFVVLFSDLPYCSRLMGYGICFLGGLCAKTVFERGKGGVSVGLFLVMLQAAFGLAYLSPYDFFYIYRIHCFSVPYLLAVLFAVVMVCGLRGVRNLAFMVALGCVAGFMVADLEAQKVWYLRNNQDERLIERLRRELVMLLEQGKHYRLTTLGNVCQQIKFTSMSEPFLSAALRERYREFYAVGYFLPSYFSDGLFLYENENPIWADAIKLNSGFYYALANERVGVDEKMSAHIFAKSFGDDKVQMLEALSKMHPYPHPAHYFIGQKDIFLMFENGVADRNVLQSDIRMPQR